MVEFMVKNTGLRDNVSSILTGLMLVSRTGVVVDDIAMAEISNEEEGTREDKRWDEYEPST